MTIADFMKYFYRSFVCKLVTGYKFSDMALPIEKNGQYRIMATITDYGEYTFGISQRSNRSLPLNNTYKYSDVNIDVVYQNEDTGNWQTLKSSSEEYIVRDNYVEFLQEEALYPGEYSIQVQVRWKSQVFKDYKNDLTLFVNAYG